MDDKIYYGMVVFYDHIKGLGRIKGNDKEDCFLHHTEIRDGASLAKWDNVSYRKRPEPDKRNTRAIEVKKL